MNTARPRSPQAKKPENNRRNSSKIVYIDFYNVDPSVFWGEFLKIDSRSDTDRK
jgi:hypothetical protein